MDNLKSAFTFNLIVKITETFNSTNLILYITNLISEKK